VDGGNLTLPLVKVLCMNGGAAWSHRLATGM